MRLKINFSIDKPVNLTFNYQYLLSSWVYKIIYKGNSRLGKWLHEKGCLFKGKNYKPILFSNVFFDESKVVKSPKHSCLQVDKGGYFYFDSFRKDICYALMEGTWQKEKVILNDKEFVITSVEIVKDPHWNSPFKAKTLGPICAPYVSNNKLQYSNPLESKFYDVIRNNLLNWYEIIYRKPSELKKDDIKITIDQSFNFKKAEKLIDFKGKKIKGYQFKFTLDAPSEVLEVAYRAGLGSYGSQGFGMVSEIGEC
ncbi:CRISPR-associated endoribonuclease Cas6 [Natranaerobius trueperi]|uniref:CRISPR-associated endoribonuclease n=1 Tax=Natranaerobius trueperi TaxID=759412 RepID=A0A226C043_9FIRM|nr:CRISPR-associated endoribonuclease Cas6 [Natranaerobius trueperi]OWZ83740.1 CRISPR-associated endoribonuclease Cas6 [Natranaerobius trueperi]